MTGTSPALVDADRAAELAAAAWQWPSLDLEREQVAGLELLLLGAFGPVPCYPEDTERDGLRVPALLVPADAATGLGQGDTVALRDPDGPLPGVLRISRVRHPGEPVAAGQPPPRDRATLVGPDDGTAPGAEPVPAGSVLLTGRVEGLRLPRHRDYPGLRLRPDEVRALLVARGWQPPASPGTGPTALAGTRPATALADPLAARRLRPWAVWADGLLHTADIARIRALTRQGRRCVVLAPVGGADPADRRFHLRIRALRAALDALDQPLRPTEATLAHASLAAEATARPPEPEPARPAPGAPADLAAAPVELAQPARALLVLVPVVPSARLAAPREPGMSATSPLGARAGDENAEADRTAELTALRAHLAEFYGLGGSLTGPALGAPGRAELASLLAAGAPIPPELTPPGVAAELTRAHADGWLLG